MLPHINEAEYVFLETCTRCAEKWWQNLQMGLWLTCPQDSPIGLASLLNIDKHSR